MFFSTNELQHKDTLAIGLFKRANYQEKQKKWMSYMEEESLNY